MRKSVWLLSAGFVALSAPAFAQETDSDQTSTADRRRRPRPRPSMTPRPTRRTPQQDRRHHRHRDPPQRSAVSDVPLAVTAVTGETMQNRGATDIRQLNQVSPVAARLLDLVGSRRRRRPHPRHRHGRRQSRPRKLGRGVHRRRLSLAHRRRPDRARPGRPDRGAARTAGHLVRPQRVGRPDPRSSPPSRSSRRNLRRGRRSAITTCAASSSAPPGRSPTRSRRASTASG